MVVLVLFACDREFERCSNEEDCTQVPAGAAPVCLLADMESPGFCSWGCDTDRDCVSDEGPARVCSEFDPFDYYEGKTCVVPCHGPADCGRGWDCGSIGGSGSSEHACYP